MVIVIVNPKQKLVSSREGMKRTVSTSHFYDAWVCSVEDDIALMEQAIVNRDFKKLGTLTEKNALMMHATMFGADPPLVYWEPESILVMEIVKELRSSGISCYFTLDAGPNVKILCRLSESGQIRDRLIKVFDEDQVIITGPGPGISPL